MNFSRILGHKRQISFLERFGNSSSGSGVFVFSGPEHIGKATVARTFLAGLLEVLPDELFRHPDAILLAPEVKENGARSYDIDTVRDALRRLSQSAVRGKIVCLIDDADALSTASQNALLKTLEEPSRNTVIVLIAHELSSLLPTVRSRATVLQFWGTSPAPSDDVLAYVKQLASTSSVERLKAVQAIAKDEAIDMEVVFQALLVELHRTAIPSAQALSAVLEAREKLRANGNSTIVLTELAVQLG